MAFELNKIAALGKGLKINVGKNGVSISGKVKKLKLSIGPKGLTASGPIPGTDINYSQRVPFPKKKKASLEVIEKGTSAVFLTQEYPKELRSSYYYIQSILGGLGILLVFITFKYPYAFIAGIACIYGKSYWRKLTDPALHHYKNAFKSFRSKKYGSCIEEINKVLKAPAMNRDLMLVKAECYLELEDFGSAHSVYSKYFNIKDLKSLNSKEYIPAIMNAAILCVEREDSQLLLKLAEALPDETLDKVDYKVWKHYFRGVAFMGQKDYQVAIDAFKNAVGKKQKLEEPLIDCHYQMGICHFLLGKTSLAKQAFQKVYSFNTGYKNISSIYNRINKGEGIEEFI